MFKGYLSDDPKVLVSLMQSAYLSAGLDPSSYSDEWACIAAAEALEKLVEIENKVDENLEEEQHEDEADSGSDRLEQDAQSCDGFVEVDEYVDVINASVGASYSECMKDTDLSETEKELEDCVSKNEGDAACDEHEVKIIEDGNLADPQVTEGVAEIKIEDETEDEDEEGIPSNEDETASASVSSMVKRASDEMGVVVNEVEETINQPKSSGQASNEPVNETSNQQA